MNLDLGNLAWHSFSFAPRIPHAVYRDQTACLPTPSSGRSRPARNASGSVSFASLDRIASTCDYRLSDKQENPLARVKKATFNILSGSKFPREIRQCGSWQSPRDSFRGHTCSCHASRRTNHRMPPRPRNNLWCSQKGRV